MCRWLAYSGSPIPLEDLLYKPRFSLIDQSRHGRLGAQTTNGDGFGVGWYGVEEDSTPTLFRGVGPARGDTNLRELSRSVRSPLFLAHIRASTGTPVQQTNCHPFRYGRWLWLHNGLVSKFDRVKRDLVFAVDRSLYPSIAGSTDSEVMFHLALTFGLTEDPVGAVARMAGFVESVGHRHGVSNPIQMTVATTDGERIWVFRYSSERDSRSLYVNTAGSALRDLYPEHANLRRLSDESRIVVSEPLVPLVGVWRPMPESSYGIVQKGEYEVGHFQPSASGRLGQASDSRSVLRPS
jgi:glutamine amidotransferase